MDNTYKPWMHLVVCEVENSWHQEGQPSNNQHDVERSSGEAIDVHNIITPVAHVEHSTNGQSINYNSLQSQLRRKAFKLTKYSTGLGKQFLRYFWQKEKVNK